MAGSLSTFTSLTAFGYPIPERSEATPGLWNNVFSGLSANLDTLNSSVSFAVNTSVGTAQVIGGISTNTLATQSGNTILISAGAQSIVGRKEPSYTSSYNALWFGSAASANTTRIQNAFNQAAADGVYYVVIPQVFLPYDASTITFNTGVRAVREGGRWDVYDVQAYGANPLAGTVDVSSAFSAAASAALAQLAGLGGNAQPGTVWIPSGFYSCYNTLMSIATNSSIVISGEGENSVLLMSSNFASTNSVRPLISIVGSATSRINRPKIEHIRIKGNADSVNDGIAIDTDFTTSMEINDVGIEGVYNYAARFPHAWGLSCHRLRIYDCGNTNTQAMVMYGQSASSGADNPNTVFISHCGFERHHGAGVRFWNAANITCNNSYFHGRATSDSSSTDAQEDLIVRAATDIAISNCYFAQCRAPITSGSLRVEGTEQTTLQVVNCNWQLIGSSGATTYAIWLGSTNTNTRTIFDDLIFDYQPQTVYCLIDSTHTGQALFGRISRASATASLYSNAASPVQLMGGPLSTATVTLASGITLSTDASLSGPYYVILASNTTVAIPTNAATAQRITHTIIQDGTGGRSVAWNTNFKNAWADAGNLANKRSSIAHVYDGFNWNQDGAQTPYV